MKATERSIALIKEFEGFSGSAYYCPAGKKTIGYGHVVLKGESFKEPVSKTAAHNLLASDLRIFEAAINHLVTVDLSQEQFDAIISLVYNIGEGAFARSTLLKRLNEGKYRDAAVQFDRWVYSNKKKLPGLVRRRAAEKAMFLKGTAPEPFKPLTKSRELIGSTVAVVGTAGDIALTEAKDAIEPIVGYSDTLRWVFIALVLGGLALTIYGRISNRRRGLV